MMYDTKNNGLKVKVSVVAYFNSAPFIYGLTNTRIKEQIILHRDHPAECARKLTTGEVQLGLVPIAIIPQIESYSIVSNYCIGSNGSVKTVALLSNSPLSEIDTILLDSQSRTSNQLIQILAKKLWQQSFSWKYTDIAKGKIELKPNEGLLAIGDKVFDINGKYRHNLDLASEWKRLTGLPFVFATWTSNSKLPKSFIGEFNNALRFGLSNLPLVAQQYAPESFGSDALDYLTQSISYNLTEDKQKAMEQFWKFSGEL